MGRKTLLLSLKFKAVSTFKVLLVGVILLGGCQDAENPDPAPRLSTWGNIIQISQTPTIDAPVILESNGQVVTAWVDTDLEDSSVVQSMRAVSGEFLSSASELPLPPIFPFNQQMSTAAQNHMHLLWMDAAYDDVNGGVRLWSAIITPDLLVERGPIRLTQPPVYHYDSLSNPDNSLWVVWSTAPAAEPTLRARWIDSVGRPREPFTLIGNGNWPALVRTNNGQIIIFWLDGKTNTVYRSLLQENTLTETIHLTESPHLAAGDTLTHFDVGLDTTHAYALWNIQRASGAHEVWFATGLLDGQQWSGAERLGIVAADEPYLTGFNGGSAFSATEGENWPQQAALLAGQYDNLVITAQLGGTIGLILMQGGKIQGYMRVTELESGFLLAPPSITADDDRHLYLSWSEPVNENTAHLFLTQTR